MCVVLLYSVHTVVCVFQRVGCDDVVGSEEIRDRCGVCGGDGRSCKLISGLFQHSLSKVGYLKIIDIPPGATKINITEMMKSKNYLGQQVHHLHVHVKFCLSLLCSSERVCVCCAALRSRSGRSIINGNWAIDRPGMYEGAGTMFTYRRPNEISSTTGESLLADGPTDDILEVYVSERERDVHYTEYSTHV